VKKNEKIAENKPLIPVKTSDESDERESQTNSRDAEIAGDRPPHHG
jgi:hypothetical protein